MSKLTNDDKATAAPCYYDNASSKKEEVRNKKQEGRIERKKGKTKKHVLHYITEWTGMATNTLFFITEGIVTETLADCK